MSQSQNQSILTNTECSPIKHDLQEHFVRKDQSNKLLNSTPILHCQNKSAIPNTTPQVTRARVNFHSIEDLASSQTKPKCENDQTNDSGYLSSFINSMLLQQSLSSPYSPFNYRSSSRNEYINDSNNYQTEDKENSDLKLNNDGKKLRTTFTDAQKRMLEIYFQTNPYPDPKETEDLSEQLSLAECVIKVWFQNKRSRSKSRKATNSKRIFPSEKDSMLVSNLKALSSQYNNNSLFSNC